MDSQPVVTPRRGGDSVDGFRKSLPALIGWARKLLDESLAGHPGLSLVACSGGPDSLALAAIAAFFTRSARRRRDIGAIVVDHGLQADSTRVSRETVAIVESLGLSPVLLHRVELDRLELGSVELGRVELGSAELGSTETGNSGGPEAAARAARYAAFELACQSSGATSVLLGHTRNDQAEQVMLGLLRGSGTRSLSGIRKTRNFSGGVYLRPFLELSRDETLRICELEGLKPWHDPSNSDVSFTRNRVRHRALPFLEAELGAGVTEALARSATILAEDADYLDAQAQKAFADVCLPADELSHERRAEELSLSEDGLIALPPALRKRVLALAVRALGGEQPSFERLRAAESLLVRAPFGPGSVGPVQLAGHVVVYRAKRSASGRSYGRLVMKREP